jgi:hypothetical protein
MSFSREFRKRDIRETRKRIFEWIYLAAVLGLLVAYFSFPEKWDGLSRVFLWTKALLKTIWITGV